MTVTETTDYRVRTSTGWVGRYSLDTGLVGDAPFGMSYSWPLPEARRVAESFGGEVTASDGSALSDGSDIEGWENEGGACVGCERPLSSHDQATTPPTCPPPSDAEVVVSAAGLSASTAQLPPERVLSALGHPGFGRGFAAQVLCDVAGDIAAYVPPLRFREAVVGAMVAEAIRANYMARRSVW